MSPGRKSSLVFILSVSSFLWLNEARTAQKSALALETEYTAATELRSAAMDAMLSSMTFDHAVRLVEASGHSDKKILHMIQAHAHKHHRHHKKVRGVSQPVSGQPTGSAGNSQSNYAGGVWAALHRMNEMMLETLEKWDLKEIQCRHYNESTLELLEDLEQDLLTLKPLISDATSDKNSAASLIQKHKDAASKLEDDITNFLKEMTAELTSLNSQLGVAIRDQKVMSKILNMTECNDASTETSMAQTNAELLQCTNTRTGKSYQKINIRSAEMRREFAGMQHPKVVSLLRAAGINVDDNVRFGAGFIQKSKMADCGCACRGANASYQALFGAEQRNNTCNVADPKRFSFLDNCCVKDWSKATSDGAAVEPCCPVPTMSPEAGYGVDVTNTSSDVDPALQGEKCSIAGSSLCPELRERFLNINGGIWDTITQLRYLIRQTEFRKEQGHELMQTELRYHNDVAESENEKLGRATAELSTLLETERQKQNLYAKTKGEWKGEMEDCAKTVKELESEYCALMIIRGKLLEMDALPNNVTDCRVSKWREEECSLTCGGGVRMNTRSVEIEPDHGYHCPALEVKTECYTTRCPLDCELADWTGWSACSAYCDGGVMDRIRPTLVHPTRDGTPCDTSDDAQDCNTAACDKDCVLEDWTPWSPSCTKMCGGGRQIRYRHIKEAAYGRLGTCPEFHDARRFQWKPCNTQDCVHDDHKLVLCEAKLDIILAIDGSGSLQESGWEAVKMSAMHFAGSMGSGVKLGALVFDSARYEKEGDVCMGHLPRSAWKGPWTNCGVRWAHRLSMDTGAVQEAIRGMDATFRGTMTNIAVDQASEEFALNGRGYANSILVIFTDGHPQSPIRLSEAAARYKETGRLLIVTVGADFMNDEYFQGVVSYPYQDNIVSVSDFKELTTRTTQDTIVQQFCPNIILQPDPNNPPPAEGPSTLLR